MLVSKEPRGRQASRCGGTKRIEIVVAQPTGQVDVIGNVPFIFTEESEKFLTFVDRTKSVVVRRFDFGRNPTRKALVCNSRVRGLSVEHSTAVRDESNLRGEPGVGVDRSKAPVLPAKGDLPGPVRSKFEIAKQGSEPVCLFIVIMRDRSARNRLPDRRTCHRQTTQCRADIDVGCDSVVDSSRNVFARESVVVALVLGLTPRSGDIVGPAVFGALGVDRTLNRSKTARFDGNRPRRIPYSFLGAQ